MTTALSTFDSCETEAKQDADGGERRVDFRARELERLLRGDIPRTHVEELQELLKDPVFQRQQGLNDAESAAVAYRRARFLARALRLTGAEIEHDPRRLYALHEWVGVVDGVACTVLSIHYCLALGSIMIHGEDRPELSEFVEELEHMDSVGVFLATEIGYGNNVASLETAAVYDPETREFVVSSPTPRSYKFMPNTGHAVPKLAVVMARLFSHGKDRGIFPFVVRIRDAKGVVCPGVQVSPLGEKPGNALDNAVTLFEQVRIPKAHLLTGPDSTLHDDGRFETRIPNRHRRFLMAMDRVQTGRVCFTSTAVSMLRAATWIAMRYASQRRTFAPGRRSTPLLSYRNVQLDVYGALSSAYALTFALRCVQKRFRLRTAETEAESFREVAVFKAMATSEVAARLARLRERCGAVGLLSENRLLEYWNQVQGIVTAEGDNQLMLLKVGRQLRDVAFDLPILPERVDDLTTLDPRGCLSLLRFRECRMRQELCGEVASEHPARSTFALWNENVNGTIVLGATYGERFIAECFEAELRSTGDTELADWLGKLFSLWSLDLLERHSGWFLAEGCLTGRAVKQMPRIRDRLCSAIEPHAPALVEAFGLENSILRAPIAEDDYVQAYAPPAGRPVVRAWPLAR
jgi:acyl-CoA oxidase